MRMRRISPRLRLERCFDHAHPGSQSFQHLLKDMIARKTQVAVFGLYRYMPVTQVIRRTHETLRRIAFDMEKRLGLRNDFHHTAVRRKQQITAAEDLAPLKLEPCVLAAFELRAQPALLAKIECEPHARLRLHGSVSALKPAGELDQFDIR